METQSERIQKQIDAANAKILESKKKLALAIQKEKAEKYDLIVELFSDEKSKYRDAQINGEKAIDFINRKIDEKLEADAAKKKAAKEQKADADSSDEKSKKDVAKDESSSTSKTDKQAVKEQAASGKQVEVNRTPKRIDPTTGRPIYQ